MLKNIAWTVLSRYSAQILAIVANVLLVRYLGTSGYGEYALASGVMLIGNSVTSFGMDMVIIRRITVKHDPGLLVDGLWGQVFLSLIFIIGTFIVGIFISIPLSVKIYTFALLPLAFYSIFTIAIRGRQNMQVFSIAQFMITALHLLSVGILWLLHGSVLVFVLLLTLSHVVVAGWGFMRPELQVTNMPFSFSRTLAVLKDSSHLAVNGIANLIYEKLPVTFLSTQVGFSQVGVFSVATRLVDSGKLGHLSAFTAMFPEMARDEEFGRKLKGFRPMVATSVLVALGLFFLAEPAILILFGSEFSSAVILLRIMCGMTVLYVLASYFSLGLVALGFDKLLFKANSITLAVLVCLLVGLTSKFGLTGAASAVLLGELTRALLFWRLWRKHVFSKLPS